MNLGVHIITRIAILHFKAAIARGDISWENPRGVVQFPEKDLSPVGKKLFEMFSRGAAHLIPIDEGRGYCLGLGLGLGLGCGCVPCGSFLSGSCFSGFWNRFLMYLGTSIATDRSLLKKVFIISVSLFAVVSTSEVFLFLFQFLLYEVYHKLLFCKV
jgi:hypothetical protein